jgi:hypothetical protein
MEFGALTLDDILELVKKIGPDGIRGILQGDLEVVRAKFLEPVCEIRVDGIEMFDAANAFGPDNPAGIKFWLKFAGAMDEIFLRGLFERVYENTQGSVIKVNRLVKDAGYSEIFEKGKKCIRLAHLYKLIEAYFQILKWLLGSSCTIVALVKEEENEEPFLVFSELDLPSQICKMVVGLPISFPYACKHVENYYFLGK